MTFRKEFLAVLLVTTGLLAYCYYEGWPIGAMMDWRNSRNALAERQTAISDYEIFDLSEGNPPGITIDVLKGKHFWHPQVAIWLEDSAGNFLETLLVTTSTARGLFYSGRSAENFRNSDHAKTRESSPTRRVDALPYWSHKRGHRYSDGFYSPPPGQPLPDAVTSATPGKNFLVQAQPSSLQSVSTFNIMVELNVAFDENEYYSEYDFPEDSLYHSGTGLLGQPSLVYAATVRRSDDQRYYMLSLIGHGHHSGSTGELFHDTKTITTARYIVERIVAGVAESWYPQPK